jgi:hypothetical protein
MEQAGISQLWERLRRIPGDFSFPADRPVFLLAVAAGLAMLVGLLYWNTLQAVSRMEKNVASRQVLYADLAGLADQVKSAGNRQRKTGVDDSDKQIDSLLAWLEKQVRAAALEDKVRQISPVIGKDLEMFRERASLKLDAVAMTEAIKFIDLIEKAPGTQIISSDIRRQSESAGGISLTLELGLL